MNNKPIHVLDSIHLIYISSLTILFVPCVRTSNRWLTVKHLERRLFCSEFAYTDYEDKFGITIFLTFISFPVYKYLCVDLPDN